MTQVPASSQLQGLFAFGGFTGHESNGAGGRPGVAGKRGHHGGGWAGDGAGGRRRKESSSRRGSLPPVELSVTARRRAHSASVMAGGGDLDSVVGGDGATVLSGVGRRRASTSGKWVAPTRRRRHDSDSASLGAEALRFVATAPPSVLPGQTITLHVKSYDYNRGVPVECLECFYDVSSVPSPWFVKDFKRKTGLDDDVRNAFWDNYKTEYGWRAFTDWLAKRVREVADGRSPTSPLCSYAGGQDGGWFGGRRRRASTSASISSAPLRRQTAGSDSGSGSGSSDDDDDKAEGGATPRGAKGAAAEPPVEASLVVGISCGTGRHLSVLFAERASKLVWPGVVIEVEHLDVGLKKPGGTGGADGSDGDGDSSGGSSNGDDNTEHNKEAGAAGATVGSTQVAMLPPDARAWLRSQLPAGVPLPQQARLTSDRQRLVLPGQRQKVVMTCEVCFAQCQDPNTWVHHLSGRKHRDAEVRRSKQRGVAAVAAAAAAASARGETKPTAGAPDVGQSSAAPGKKLSKANLMTAADAFRRHAASASASMAPPAKRMRKASAKRS